MSASRLMELYPESKTKPKVKWRKNAVFLEQISVGECFADVEIKTNKPLVDEGATVQSVQLEGYGCAGATFRALVSKYGSPLDIRNAKEDDLLRFNDKVRDAIWKDGEKVMHFKSESGGVISYWKLTYTPASKEIGL